MENYYPIIIGVVVMLLIIITLVISNLKKKRGNGQSGKNTTGDFLEIKDDPKPDNAEFLSTETVLPKDFENLPADELFKIASEQVDEKGYKKHYNLWVACISAAAEKGLAAAQFELGKFYKYKNNSEALKWLNLACQNGSADAAVELADIYQMGIDYGEPVIHKNIEGAIAVVKPYAERGNADAQYILAYILNYRNHDEDGATVWYEKAAAQNHKEALKELAEIYSYNEDWEGAKKLLERAANLDDTDAMTSLAGLYYCDDKPDYEKAVEWYKRAVDCGDGYAMCALGKMYLKGKGVLKDALAAVELFERAANQNSDYAKYLLGRCYMYGDGVEIDKATGIKLYTEAAEYDCDAQYALALCYLEGDGVKRNNKTAISYLEKAVEDDVSGNSAYKLGELYYAGEVVKKNDDRARAYWRKAVEWMHEDAKECLKIYFGEVAEN